MADESILWPESDGSDTSDPSAEFSEFDYTPLETVRGSQDKATTVTQRNGVYAIVTSESISEGEDGKDKTGYINVDVYDSGLDQNPTNQGIEAFSGNYFRTLVNDDIVLLGRNAEGEYFVKDVARVCLYKITEIVDGTDSNTPSKKYKARKYILWIDENDTNLEDALSVDDLTIQNNDFLIYDYNDEGFAVGDICLGLRSGVRWENSDEVTKKGIIVPITPGGRMMWIKITGTETFTDTTLTFPGTFTPAGNLQRAKYKWIEQKRIVEGEWQDLTLTDVDLGFAYNSADIGYFYWVTTADDLPPGIYISSPFIAVGSVIPAWVGTDRIDFYSPADVVYGDNHWLFTQQTGNLTIVEHGPANLQGGETLTEGPVFIPNPTGLRFEVQYADVDVISDTRLQITQYTADFDGAGHLYQKQVDSVNYFDSDGLSDWTGDNWIEVNNTLQTIHHIGPVGPADGSTVQFSDISSSGTNSLTIDQYSGDFDSKGHLFTSTLDDSFTFNVEFPNWTGDDWISVDNVFNTITHIGPVSAGAAGPTFSIVTYNGSTGSIHLTQDLIAFDSKGHQVSVDEVGVSYDIDTWLETTGDTSTGTPTSVSPTKQLNFDYDGLFVMDNGSGSVTVSLGNLGGHHDVIITTPSDGDYLKWNGTDWVNATPVTITYVSDVFISGTDLMQTKRTAKVFEDASDADSLIIEGGDCSV